MLEARFLDIRCPAPPLWRLCALRRRIVAWHRTVPPIRGRRNHLALERPRLRSADYAAETTLARVLHRRAYRGHACRHALRRSVSAGGRGLDCEFRRSGRFLCPADAVVRLAARLVQAQVAGRLSPDLRVGSDGPDERARRLVDPASCSRAAVVADVSHLVSGGHAGHGVTGASDHYRAAAGVLLDVRARTAGPYAARSLRFGGCDRSHLHARHRPADLLLISGIPAGSVSPRTPGHRGQYPAGHADGHRLYRERPRAADADRR